MDLGDEDDTDSTGLTEKTFERLENALRAAGFEITEGPSRSDVLIEES
jgi:hypothetical protein